MIWIKSALAGLVAATLAVMAIVMATAAWMVNVQIGAGSGGIGAVSFGVIELVLLPAAVGFAMGFWWMLRRQRRVIQ